MKSNSKLSRVFERYGMIEALEARIAPAAVGNIQLPANPTFQTVSAGGGTGSNGVTSLLLKAGEVLTTGSGPGGSYLLYVSQGEIMVHITDLNNNGQLDFNEITGISVGNNAVFTSFVDIHGDVVTDLNPDGTLSHQGAGDILLDNSIAEIDLRSVASTDFTATANATAAQLASDHLALSSYSIFGNIYAGAGLGAANNPNSGLHIDTTGTALQQAKFSGATGTNFYQASTPVIGSIYVGSSASGKYFSFGSSGSPADVFGNLLTFTPAPGEAGASIYNISSGAPGEAFSIGTIHAGDGGFNAPGGNIVNVALQGDNAGTYQLIAGNAGQGTTGQAGGSILNFSETGAIISEVVLQSGNGGTGLTGAGGNAGVITFNAAQASVDINAHFVLNYGSGGNGYTKGGTGGGTTSGTFITPSGNTTTPLNLVTTMHSIGTIGNTTPIDFNGDGISDAVFSTTSPNQVVVALGEYIPTKAGSVNGQFTLNASEYIYLNSPATVDSIVVGDFTGNGHPDIAVASGSGSNAGIEVYLSQYNPKTGAFLGFSDPLFSPLPTFNNFYTTTVEITKLVAGAFTPDTNLANLNPVMDLAVLAQETVLGTSGGVVDSVLIFLNGETNATHPYGSGYFYANTKLGNEPYINFGNNFNDTQSTFIATALKSFTPGAGYDVIAESNFDATYFNIISDKTGAPGVIGGNGWGEVFPPGYKNPTQFYDQAFTVTADPTTPNIADIVAVSQIPQAYMVTFQGNGTAGGFTLTSGAGVGIDFAYGTNVEPVAIVAIPAPPVAPATTVNNGAAVWSDVAILDYNNDGGDVVHLLQVTETPTTVTNPNPPPMTTTAVVGDAVQYTAVGTINPAARTATEIGFGAYVPIPLNNAAITGSGPASVGFITANPLNQFDDYQGIEITQPLLATGGAAYLPTGGAAYVPTKLSGYFINAGNGGNSEAGYAGAGGSLGLSLTATQVATTAGESIVGTGTLSITFPEDPNYDGHLVITAGQGGNGFLGGGNGGTLQGISLTYATTTLTGDALLFSGNGGQSLTGIGGNGGSESQLYIASGQVFVAGNGGIGVRGGSGGSLIGDMNSSITAAQTNNLDPVIVLQAGSGATGITGGGNGGSINSWVDEFNQVLGGNGGDLNYTAGSAGNAVAGFGGNGGSIINSSPASFDNNLVGDIYLKSGDGGSGETGGNGGGITNFANISTVQASPTTTTFIAGMGGDASLGVGGKGGSISQISASSTGEGHLYTYNFSDPQILTDADAAQVTKTPISYNRMVAGQGGSSAGGVGGIGGGVGGTGGYIGSTFNINTASAAGGAANVIVAGAGGSGLSAGGAGGSVVNVTADAGSAGGKVLLIAGDGGAATGAKANPSTDVTTAAYNNAFALGGTNGPGGNGGSILTFTQSTSSSTHVDLIAGNGGATPNHGTTDPQSNPAGYVTTDNSGVGGSIENISIAGSIGNTAVDTQAQPDAQVAIKSYNNIFAGQTMQQFVNTYILGDPTAPMDDTVGNVGLVAGAAGRVYGVPGTTFEGLVVPADGLPSGNGIAGTVTNIHAENIMSMVAGNVDQVAQIQSLTNYNVTILGGILGSNKTLSSIPGYTGVIGQLNYIDPQGNLVDTPLPGGGALLDGAFMAKNHRNILGIRDFNGTVYSS